MTTATCWPPPKNAKTYSLARDPRAVLCLFNAQWPGPWMHVEGDADVRTQRVVRPSA